METIFTEDLSRIDLYTMIHQLRAALIVLIDEVPCELLVKDGVELSMESDEVQLAKEILKKTDIK